MSLLDPVSVPPLAEAYPCAPARLRHYLAEEPLLSLPALADAARVLPRSEVGEWGEPCEVAGLPQAAPQAPADPLALLQSGGPGRRGVVLRDLMRLPGYRALVLRLVRELEPVIARATGPMQSLRARAFISWTNLRTPFHFNPAYMLLLQIRGDRVLAAYPAAPPFLDLARREAHLREGTKRLEWRPELAAVGHQHVLAPGDGLCLPHAAPHWVHSGEGLSIALALSWQCRRTRAEADALALNPLLRKVGLPPYDPAVRRAAPWLRAAASRAGQRLGLV